MLEQTKQYIRQEISKYRLEIIEERNIPYGLQFFVNDINTSLNEKISVTIYYSKTKGISIIVGGSDKNRVKKRVNEFIQNVKLNLHHNFQHNSNSGQNNNSLMPNINKLHSWSKWIGTDESGKGDFFGPLVAAGFYSDQFIVKDLHKLGIMDSKKLHDKQINIIALSLYAKYKNRIETVSLMPHTYNKLYANFSSQGKKLNELMAWMHSRIILNLTLKFPCQGALIDKFTSDYIVKSSLKKMNEITIIQTPKAESDIAVAAASIIARYHFLQGLDLLSNKFNIKLLKGANRKVIDTAYNFLNNYHIEDLTNICKTHFKTYQQVIDNIPQS